MVDCTDAPDSSHPSGHAPLKRDFVSPHIKVKFTSPDFESRRGHAACFGHSGTSRGLASASALVIAISLTGLWNPESTM